MAPTREIETDVLVVGAGPAGSACACELARAGLRVVLADQAAFPRDKVCGDALIPDALAALDSLGLLAAVEAQARVSDRLRICAPDGSHVDLAARCLTLRRYVLDDALQAAAAAAGALRLDAHRMSRPLERNGGVAGARFAGPDAAGAVEVHAQLTVLATGAARQPLQLFGVCRRVAPSAVAVRAYFRVPADLDADCDFLTLSYDRSICPGYGWVFPLPDRLYNVGAGSFLDGPSRGRRGLRELWSDFVRCSPLARRIVSQGEQLSPLRGAPLRTALRGAALSRPGLLVAGEAAGATYSFSGEGIGKAMQTGILAARTIADQARLGRPLAAVPVLYAQRARASFESRFAGYRRAQAWLRSPLVCNLLTRRARGNAWLRGTLEALLAETADPRAIFSLSGLARTVLG